MTEPGAQIWWWRKVTSTIDMPYRGEVLAATNARITVSVEDPAADNARVVRHVTPGRLQPVGGYCVKITNERHSPASKLYDWGPFTSFVDVADDLRSNRNINLFADGRALRYDRTHWCDDFGMLGDARLKRYLTTPWPLPGQELHEIPQSEFDALWEQTAAGELWQHQLGTSRSAQMGDTPLWLRRRGWWPPALK